MNKLKLTDKEEIMEHITMELDRLDRISDLSKLDNKTREYRDNLRKIQEIFMSNKNLRSALEELKRKEDVELAKSNKPLVFSRTRINRDNLSTEEELSSKNDLDKLLSLATELLIKTNK